MDIKDVTDLIQKQGENFDAFKKANDERLDLLAKGLPTSDVDATLATINGELKRLADENVELQKRAARRAVDGSDASKLTDAQIEYKQGLQNFMRTGDENGLKGLQLKAMNGYSDPDGGYLILPEMDLSIDRVATTMSAMLRLADVATVGSSTWEKMVKTSGLAMRRIADGSGGGESTNARYSKVKIEAFTAEVEPWVFNETLQDSFINLERDMADEAGIAFGEGFGAEAITSNGVNAFRGLLGYDKVANSAYTWGSVGYIASGGAGAFAASNPGDQMISLQHALRAQYRNGAVWLMNDGTLAAVRSIKDGSGQYYLWQPDPAAGFGGNLLGSKVEIDDNMPVIAAGSFSIAYGNINRAYKVINRQGTALIRDNLTSKGQTKFNFRRRAGGGIKHFEAVKLMKFATS